MTRALFVAIGFAVGVAWATGCLKAGAQTYAPEVEAALRETQAVWGVPAGRLRCLVDQESDGVFRAYSPAGPYFGVVQFGMPLWDRGLREARNPADPRFPLVPPGSHPYQPREALLMAGYFIARGETSHWPPLRRCP